MVLLWCNGIASSSEKSASPIQPDIPPTLFPHSSLKIFLISMSSVISLVHSYPWEAKYYEDHVNFVLFLYFNLRHLSPC